MNLNPMILACTWGIHREPCWPHCCTFLPKITSAVTSQSTHWFCLLLNFTYVVLYVRELYVLYTHGLSRVQFLPFDINACMWGWYLLPFSHRRVAMVSVLLLPVDTWIVPTLGYCWLCGFEHCVCVGWWTCPWSTPRSKIAESQCTCRFSFSKYCVSVFQG